MEKYEVNFHSILKKYGVFSKSMEKYGEVWRSMEKYGVNFHSILKKDGVFSKSIEKYGEVWRSMEKYGVFSSGRL